MSKKPVFAVLVGVQKYKHRGMTTLRYTKNDVMGLRDALVGHGGVSAGNVRVLLNQQATKRAIRKTLTVWLAGELKKRKNRNATVILFFAGHGEAHDGLSYWLPYDVKKGVSKLEETALSSDLVDGWLKKLGTRRIVIFADACHSGAWSSQGARTSGAAKSFVGKMGEGFVRLSSSQQDQVSWEDDGLKHGLFSYALIRGLKGEADFRKRGVVTVEEVSIYVKEEVEKMAKLRKDALQRPVSDGISAGVLPLSYPLLAVSALSPSPPVVQKRDSIAEREKKGVGATQNSIPAPQRKAGERRVFRVGVVDFAMRWIPSGEFVMGTGKSEFAKVMRSCRASKNTWRRCKGWHGDAPQRKVSISRGFWMMETEVTQGQYQALIGKNPSAFKGCGLDCPVEQVDWHEAAAFAKIASQKEGVAVCFIGSDGRIRGIGDEKKDYLACGGWRLPTEAEWEYAARAGTQGMHYGNLGDIAWWGAWEGDGNAEVSYQGALERHGKKWGTQSVGKKQANRWGLHDMLGNVWEWVYDGYSSYEQIGEVDPIATVSENNRKRVRRGGSWSSNARILRAAYRYNNKPTYRDRYLGFRLVRGGE